MKSSKIFWGIFFILAAIYVVISKFGILPDVGVFSIILTVFLIWMLLEGIRNVNFYGILFSIAGFCIVYDDQLGITELTPWTVLGAALLGSIGLSMILVDSEEKKASRSFGVKAMPGAAVNSVPGSSSAVKITLARRSATSIPTISKVRK